jgi:hypothetical protein
MTIQEIRTFKIYTRLNTSHERTIRIQQSQHINSFDGSITQSQEALISNFKGKYSYRQNKYEYEERKFENKPCQPPIIAIYKRLKWLPDIQPIKRQCKSKELGDAKYPLQTKNCRLGGICKPLKCLWTIKIYSRICHLCYYPMNQGLLPIEKFTL